MLLMNTAAPKTKSKLASQLPVTSRKSNTLLGLFMSAMANPAPNNRPLMSATMFLIMIKNLSCGEKYNR